MTDPPEEGWSPPDSEQPRSYAPVPQPRPNWAPEYLVEQATPERWFEPVRTEPIPTEPITSAGASRWPGRPLVIVLLLASIFGAVLGGGGTYLALKSSGAFNTAAPSKAPGSISNVSVESESSAIVAAAQAVGPSVVMIVDEVGGTPDAVGSGIVYDTGGWILTNKHVIAGATTIKVRLQDKREFDGTVYGQDTLTDLAIVKISGATGLKAAPLGDSSTLQVGQLAVAIGSPLGLDYPNSVTSGIVSGLGRDITVAGDGSSANSGTNLHGLIQTDAAINPGNSGGPLIDSAGRVIGVSTAIAQTAQGIGFAIPINVAKPILQQALAGEKLSRPYIGIAYVAIDLGLKTQNNLPLDHGAWVHNEDASGNSIDAVVAGSPADKAGIKNDDIITAIEGEAIDGAHPLEDLLVQYAPGRTVSVDLYRGGKALTVHLTLGTRPATSS
jgi:S1-C subfamily serine protease